MKRTVFLKTRVFDEKDGLLKDRSTSIYGRDREF